MPKERRACLAEMKMNSYLEKHLDLTIKLSHVSFCSPLFEPRISRLARENAGICLPCLDHMVEASLTEPAVRQKVER